MSLFLALKANIFSRLLSRLLAGFGSVPPLLPARAMSSGGLFRLLASAAIILTAITTVHPSEGASSTDDADINCVTELSACLDDDTCLSCISEYDQTGYTECITTPDYDGFPSISTGTELVCYSATLSPCCQDEHSDKACMNNDAFVEYWECIIQQLDYVGSDCPVSESTCNGASSFDSESDSGDDGGPASSDDSSEDGGSAGVGSSGGGSTSKPSSLTFICVWGLAAVLLSLTRL